MNDMRMFAQITKVDEAKRLVYTRVVDETPDRADERFDYAKSKPYFEAWSKNQFDASGGKSYGNVRAMHGKVAAGVIPQPLTFGDTGGTIDAVIHVVDDQEWAKVLTGTYTGASIGGSYVGAKVEEKIGDRTVKRYVADPVEISLVDSPCIPTARFFDVVKADGAIEKRAFVQEVKVEGSPEQADAFAKLLADNSISIEAVTVMVTESLREMAANKAERYMLATVEKIEEQDAAKREFSADERKSAAKEGAALPDGSFPIKSVGDLENAIRAYGRAKDKAAAKAHIIKRAKALGASDKIPEAWTKSGEKTPTKELTLKKGAWAVGNFAECLECLAGVARSAQYDLEAEGDDSPVPMKLRNVLADAIEVFKEMSVEEADEMLAELKDHAGVGEDDEIEQAMEAAVRATSLKKRLADPKLPFAEFEKLANENLTPEELAAAKGNITSIADALMASDRISKAIVAKAFTAAHMDKLQAIHDHVASMGADCNAESAKSAQPEGLAKVADLTAQVAALTATVEHFKKMPVPHIMLRTVQKEVARSEPQQEPEQDAAKAVAALLAP